MIIRTNRMNGICLALFQQFPKQKKPVSVHAYFDERKAQIACLEICIDYMVKRVPNCTNIKKSRSHRIREFMVRQWNKHREDKLHFLYTGRGSIRFRKK